MDENNPAIQQILKSAEFQDAKKIIAYTIKKTPTKADDIALTATGALSKAIAEELSDIDRIEVSDKEAVGAALRIGKSITDATPNKWDDRLLARLTGVFEFLGLSS